MGETQETVSAPTKRGLRSDQASGVVLLLLALFIGWQNRSYPLGTLQEPGPGYVPLMLAIFLGIVGLLVALRGTRAQPLRDIAWPEAPRAVIILIACGVAAYALERLGYRLTVFALLVFFLGVIERKRWYSVLLVSAGFSLLSYFLFDTVLKVQLPHSPWGY
ncbi:MAG: tripartite tricarboxylate transporter TctB family protein [Rhodospirillaceae bacterium]